MPQDATEDRIRSIVAKIFDLPAGEVRLDARFVEDLGADSLHRMELLMALEDSFHLEVPETDAQTLGCARDVLDYVRRHAR